MVTYTCRYFSGHLILDVTKFYSKTKDTRVHGHLATPTDILVGIYMRLFVCFFILVYTASKERSKIFLSIHTKQLAN